MIIDFEYITVLIKYLLIVDLPLFSGLYYLIWVNFVPMECCRSPILRLLERGCREPIVSLCFRLALKVISSLENSFFGDHCQGKHLHNPEYNGNL